MFSSSIRTPFQGDLAVGVIPRAEALGCFVFALRARQTSKLYAAAGSCAYYALLDTARSRPCADLVSHLVLEEFGDMNPLASLKTIQTDTLDIAYEESGQPDGKPVILLHGFPDDPRSWDGALDLLTDIGCRTIVPYLRGFGPTRFRRADTPRSGQQAALAHDLSSLIDGLRLPSAFLAGFDWGARAACTTAALWPEKVAGLVSIGGYNIENLSQDQKPVSARQEYKAWYQWYFHTERGRAGLEQNRRDICRLLWELWCPNLKFTDADFAETACSFDNPDFAAIVIHSYRHRYGAAAGDPALEVIERRLSCHPEIGVPTVVLHGDGDTIHPPEFSEGQETKFTDYYKRRVIPKAGHLFPREAPEAVVEAIQELLVREGLAAVDPVDARERVPTVAGLSRPESFPMRDFQVRAVSFALLERPVMMPTQGSAPLHPGLSSQAPSGRLAPSFPASCFHDNFPRFYLLRLAQ